MPRTVRREPQLVTKEDFLTGMTDHPARIEFVRGVIGPYSDAGKLALLANWGADDVLRITGPDVWRDALAAFSKPRKDK
jgi:hypothetical protein